MGVNEQLWAIASADLRGQMDASEFKDYMLGFMFYKFITEKFEDFIMENYSDEGFSSAMEVFNDKEAWEDIVELAEDEFGYVIEPGVFFSTIVNNISKNIHVIDTLQNGFNQLENSAKNTDAEDDVVGLFSSIDLTNQKLGINVGDRESLVASIISKINEIDFDGSVDQLGNAYEYLLQQFASSAGKKGGEFYTPDCVSRLVAKLAISENDRVQSVYDPTCGSGSLLLKAQKEGRVAKVYGQELNTTTYNLARMNMFLHGLKHNNFSIKVGNTLDNDKFNQQTFDRIVANPPFGTNWDASPSKLEDVRFMKYGKLAPKSKGEYAFIQHMLYHLSENGTMVTVVPHGVLFRGAAELTIRKYIIEKEDQLDAVIGLPSNLFYGTGIPACILVFKKCRTDKDILFIDASREFEKVKTQNNLTDTQIQKIVDTYRNRNEEEKYSRKVPISEIEENEFNLNIPRYIDTFEEEEEIDIQQVMKELKECRAEQAKLIEEINREFEEIINTETGKSLIEMGIKL